MMAPRKAQRIRAMALRRLRDPVQLGQTADAVQITAVALEPDGVGISYALGVDETPEPTPEVPDPEPQFRRRAKPSHHLDTYTDFESELALHTEGTTWERHEAAALARLATLGRIGALEES